MSAHDATQKELATHKKDERIHNAESNKQETRESNAAARHVASTHASGNGNQIFSTGARIDGSSPTPDYLTGSNISTVGHNPGPNTHVEYPQTGPGTRTGLNPVREPGPEDVVYPQDIGAGGGAAWQDPALNARGGQIN